jgi:hypothetical protein
MPDRPSPSVADPNSTVSVDGDPVDRAVDAHVDAGVEAGVEVGPDAEPRRCSRCRAVFPGVEERNAAGHVVWWLCPPCHERLLGG